MANGAGSRKRARTTVFLSYFRQPAGILYPDDHWSNGTRNRGWPRCGHLARHCSLAPYPGPDHPGRSFPPTPKRIGRRRADGQHADSRWPSRATRPRRGAGTSGPAGGIGRVLALPSSARPPPASDNFARLALCGQTAGRKRAAQVTASQSNSSSEVFKRRQPEIRRRNTTYRCGPAAASAAAASRAT